MHSLVVGMCTIVMPLLCEFGKEMKVGYGLYFILMPLVVVGMGAGDDDDGGGSNG